MGIFDWFFGSITQAGTNTMQNVISPPPGSAAYVAGSSPTFTPTIQPSSTIASTANAPYNASIKPDIFATIGSRYDQLQKEAYDIGKGIQISQASQSINSLFSDVANQIRRGEPLVSERIGNVPGIGVPAAFITSRGTKSIAGLIETAGMIPRGLETIKQRPGILPSAALIGTVWTAEGIIKGAKEDPAQLAMDFWITKRISDVRVPASIRTAVQNRVGLIEVLKPLPKSISEMPQGLLPGKQLKYQSIIGVAEKLQRTRPEIKRPLDFTQIKSLAGNRKAALEVRDFLKSITKKEDAVLGGSSAQWAQLKKARMPGDIDLNVKNPGRVAKQAEQILIKNYGKDNIKVDFQKAHNQYQISRKIGNEWHHVFDIKKTEVVGGLIERVGLPTQEPITIGGLRYKTFGELLTRKVDSAVHPQKGGTIAPQSHRIAKDLADLENLVNSALNIKKAKAEKSLPIIKQLRLKKVAETVKEYEAFKLHASLGGIEAYPEIARLYKQQPYYTRRVPQALVVAGLKPYAFVDRLSSYSDSKVPKPRTQEPYYSPKQKKPEDFIKAIESYYEPSYKEPTNKPPYKVPPYYPTSKKPPYYKPIIKVPPYESTIKAPPTDKIILTKILKPPVKIQPLKRTTEEPKKKKRKAGKKPYNWRIKNQIATLEDLLG